MPTINRYWWLSNRLKTASPTAAIWPVKQEALERADEASHKATKHSTVLYKSGLVSYIEVIDSHRTLLQYQL